MTHSIGDFQLKPYGVIAIPEIQHLKLDHKTDSFIVLHTDSVSHVRSDKEIADIVRTCPDTEQAANISTGCAIRYGSEDNVCTAPQMIPDRKWSSDRKWSPNWTGNDPKQQMIPPENVEWHEVCSSGRRFNF